MTLREVGSASGQWFSEGWCKLILMNSDGCKEQYWSNWNWLDFTIGQALFTFIPMLIVFILLKFYH